MAEELRIARYCRSDRDRVFELVRAANRSEIAERLIQHWDWKYDANPFNRGAERDRRTNRKELLDFVRGAYSAEKLKSFDRKWGVTYEALPAEREDDPYLLLLKKDGREVIAMLGSLPQRFVVAGQERWASVATDSGVHPAHRNRSLSIVLVNRSRVENAVQFYWPTVATRRIVGNWWKAASRPRGSSKIPQIAEKRLVPLVKPLDRGYLVRRITGSRLLGGAAAVMAAGAQPLKNVLADGFHCRASV